MHIVRWYMVEVVDFILHRLAGIVLIYPCGYQRTQENAVQRVCMQLAGGRSLQRIYDVSNHLKCALLIIVEFLELWSD